MMSMTKGGVTTNYGYDTAGDKISEGPSSNITKYLVDDNNPTGYSQVLETWTGSGTEPSTTYEVGAMIISQTIAGMGAGSGTQYLMPDGHGSTRQLTAYSANIATNGQVVGRDDYDGFGDAITMSSVAANVASTVILYTGQMWDPGLMMYDLRARLYETGIGRFTSYDDANIQAGNLHDANRYLYVGDSPVIFTDPSGHFTLGELCVAALIIAIAFTVVVGIEQSEPVQRILFLAGNQPINTTTDPRWNIALADMQAFSVASGDKNAGVAATYMDNAINSDPPRVFENTHFYSRGATPETSAVGTRKTTISAAHQLNASDIAVQLLGEYQRQVEQPGDSQVAHNAEINAFMAYLRQIGQPCTRTWYH